MSNNEAVVTCFAFLFILSVIAIAGGLLYARRERLLTHAERIKALEMGRELPDTKTAWIKAAFGNPSGEGDGHCEGGARASLGRKCLSTATWVAFWGFVTAAGLGGAEASSGVAYAIASSAGAIGVTAVICGAVLGLAATKRSDIHSKPAVYDHDALDVVSCRG